MTKQENMTREQAEEELRQLRKVFRSVRLLTQENVCSPGGRRPCYAQWKRTRPVKTAWPGGRWKRKAGKASWNISTRSFIR